jgi:glycosyltransferase involved in cell wall biosynthesis
MTELPWCSIITPTWNRHDLLFDRCIPSVQAQSYPRVEHIVASDGPDPELSARLHPAGPDSRSNLWYRELDWHDPAEHWGHHARLLGIEYSSGEFIGYCDDDDSLRPEHCELLATALIADPEAGFAVSRMMSHGSAHDAVIGYGPLAAGNVGTPMIMHRREILDISTWGPAGLLEDWELVNRWLAAGIKHVAVDAETSDVWPSLFR